MSKILLYASFLLLPVIAAAQSDQALVKDFEKKVFGEAGTFQLNDHINIMQVATDDKNFELEAIDDKMQPLWRATFEGNPVTCGKIKGQILAIAKEIPADKKNDGDSYLAYLVDEQTGKLLLHKVFYTNKSAAKVLLETFFAADGSYFRLAVRQMEKQHEAIVIRNHHIAETEGLTTIDLNDKLEATVTKFNLPGHYAGLTSNNAGDFFLFTLQDNKTLTASKFGAGKMEPSASITQNLYLQNNFEMGDVSYRGTVSEPDDNIIYYATVYTNADADMELSVLALNFITKSAKVVNEAFDKAHIKEIEKGFVPPDKKTDKVVIGLDKRFNLEVKHIADHNGVLIVAVERKFLNFNDLIDGAIVINGYNKIPESKFQQVFPLAKINGFTSDRAVEYHYNSNSLYLIANTDGTKFRTVYGQLDLTTGNWLKIVKLDKGKLDNTDNVQDQNLWYKDSFILIYQSMTRSLNGKVDLSLQQNSY